MKFGKVDDPDEVDFTIPPDHKATKPIFAKETAKEMEVWVGCAKWNSKDLKGFYPKGVKAKDELHYYSTQFNCIELNATFYKRYWENNYTNWREGVTDDFKFFPKFNQGVTHYARLKDVGERCEQFHENVAFLKEKLGMPFLQMHDNFGPKEFEKVENFVNTVWTYEDMPIAMEFRKSEWHNDPEVASQLYNLLESKGITNILVDTAGRRDLMHMRMTTPTPFIRWVGANHETDRQRLDEWVERLAKWKKQGMRKLYFFVHQNVEEESPLLAAHFIEKLNKALKIDLKIPESPNQPK